MEHAIIMHQGWPNRLGREHCAGSEDEGFLTEAVPTEGFCTVERSKYAERFPAGPVGAYQRKGSVFGSSVLVESSVPAEGVAEIDRGFRRTSGRGRPVYGESGLTSGRGRR